MTTKPSLKDHAQLMQERIEQWKGFRKCPRCGLPEAFRDMKFDENGVCLNCAEYLELVEEVRDYRKEGELLELLERFRDRPDTDYDVIVCYSGGKDSSFLLERFHRKYGLRVLAVTVKTGFNSPAAAKNVAKAVELLQVDHQYLDADPTMLEIYRFGFMARSDKGLECDVCDLCDGHNRRRIIELAIERNIPMIVHGMDHFQLVDAGLNRGSDLLIDKNACWPPVACDRDVFREAYQVGNLDDAPRPPLELYPFLYLPYNEAEVIRTVEGMGIVVDGDPDETNCEFVFLINVLEFLRNGYPAYIHNVSASILQEDLTLETAEKEILEWLEEYASGEHDDRVYAGLERLGLTMEQLINAGPVKALTKDWSRGLLNKK